MIDARIYLYWFRRGQSDSKANKTPLMYVSSRGGVRYDIDPPDYFFEDYDDNQQLSVARAYYAGYLDHCN